MALDIYAMDTDGNISEPKLTTVTQTIGSDIYEDDNTKEKASIIILNDDLPQTHTFHLAGDEDWVKFYALKDILYEMKAYNLGSRADVVLELYNSNGDRIIGPIDDGTSGQQEIADWTCPNNGIYYLRARQYDPTIFGDQTQYDLKIYRPVAPDNIGIIKGIITSDRNMAMIASAAVQASLGSALAQNGTFTMKVEAGTNINIQVTADNYAATTKQVNVIANQETDVNIVMAAIDQKGDVNGDNSVNLADAIVALQTLSGLTSAGTAYKTGDVNSDGKIGLGEAIYILQNLGGMR